MNIWKTVGATILVLPLAAAWAQEEDPVIKVQAWTYSDPELSVITYKGEACAERLAYLTGPLEKYVLLDVTGIPGPPGAVYTLQNNRGEIAIVKCGVAGAHDSGGGCEG